MRHRIDQLTSFVGHRLTVKPEIVGGTVRYLGLIDGQCCVTKPTQEAAISALVRRFAEVTVARCAPD
jgi:hypothetical protein